MAGCTLSLGASMNSQLFLSYIYTIGVRHCTTSLGIYFHWHFTIKFFLSLCEIAELFSDEIIMSSC